MRVHARDHRRVRRERTVVRQVGAVAQVRLLLEGGLVLDERGVGHLEREMGDREGQIEEERMIPLLLQEAERVVRHHVERVLVALILAILLGVGGIVAFEALVRGEVLVVELDALSVPPQVGRVVVVRELLVEVSEEVVEALIVRLPQGLAASESPLADRRGDVAGVLEHGPDRIRAGIERHLAELVGIGVAADLEVVADLAVARMKPRHERGP